MKVVAQCGGTEVVSKVGIAGKIERLPLGRLLQEAEFTPDWPARLDFQSARVALVQGDAMTGRRLAQRALAAIQDPEKPRWDHLRERVIQASGQDSASR